MRINTLYAKKERLLGDLRETEDEIKSLEILIRNIVQ
jgi:hypothetical protein